VRKESLSRSGFQVVDEGLKAQWSPGEVSQKKCREYGRGLAAKLG
jgi:flavorubredoxin